MTLSGPPKSNFVPTPMSLFNVLADLALKRADIFSYDYHEFFIEHACTMHAAASC